MPAEEALKLVDRSEKEKVLPESFKILIIEDSHSDYLLVVHYLSREGIVDLTKRVENEPDLLAELDKERWDLVLSDYRLPRLDVQRALELVKARVPDMPFLLISGTIGEELAVDLLKSGVEDFVSKENLVRLVPAIQRAMKSAAMQQDKRLAELELRLRERALASVSNGVVITQAEQDMPIVYLNPAFERLTGYTEEEVIGQNCRFLHGDDHQQPGLEEIRHGTRRSANLPGRTAKLPQGRQPVLESLEHCTGKRPARPSESFCRCPGRHHGTAGI